MVNLHSKFISCKDEANISRVAGEASLLHTSSHENAEDLLHLFLSFIRFTDHFDHIKSVIGAESIGIGGDYEGAVRWEKSNMHQRLIDTYWIYRTEGVFLFCCFSGLKTHLLKCVAVSLFLSARLTTYSKLLLSQIDFVLVSLSCYQLFGFLSCHLAEKWWKSIHVYFWKSYKEGCSGKFTGLLSGNNSARTEKLSRNYRSTGFSKFLLL